MRKIFKILALLFFIAACISGCTTIWEDMWIEYIPRPVIEIDTITVPSWDERELFMLDKPGLEHESGTVFIQE